MVQYKVGNLLDAPVDYICQQVNCQGRMSSGIAKAIKEKWSIVYDEYVQKYQEREDEILRTSGSFEYIPSTGETLLGEIQLIQIDIDKIVINMFAQEYYGYDGKKYTSYDAFWTCLEGIKLTVPKGSKIGFPYRIGCGLGGANWQVISTMIEEVLSKDFDVYIYMLEEK